MSLLARYPAIRTTNLDAWFENLTSRNPGTRPFMVGRSTDGRCAVNVLHLGSVTVATGRCAPYGLSVPPDGRLRVHMPFSGTTTTVVRSHETIIPAGSEGVYLPRTEMRTFFPEGIASIMLTVDKAAIRRVLDELGCDAEVDALLDRIALRTGLPGMASLRREILRVCQLHDEEPERILGLERFRRGLEDAILTRTAHALLAEPEALTGGPAVRHGPALRRCLDYLEEHAALAVSMPDMAREAGVSLRQAQILFRNALGTTPAAHLRSMRLNRARGLLQSSGDMTVTEAALASGFTHLGEFSGHYRAAFGEAPSDTLRRTRRGG